MLSGAVNVNVSTQCKIRLHHKTETTDHGQCYETCSSATTFCYCGWDDSMEAIRKVRLQTLNARPTHNSLQMKPPPRKARRRDSCNNISNTSPDILVGTRSGQAWSHFWRTKVVVPVPVRSATDSGLRDVQYLGVGPWVPPKKI